MLGLGTILGSFYKMYSDKISYKEILPEKCKFHFRTIRGPDRERGYLSQPRRTGITPVVV